jgi:tetratricopeptide (TPR) repeat protein
MTVQEERYQQAMSQGHSAAWDQEWDRAASFYRQALDEKKDDLKALTSLALAYYELEEHEESLRYYLRIAEMTPEDPVPLEKAAQLYERLRKFDIGAETAVKAAELYLKNQDVNKAIENWSRAVALNPEHLRAHSRLAIVYERMEKKPQAVREYIHIASLMQHGKDMDKAVQAVNRALKVSPNSEEALQALRMLRDGALLPKPSRPRGGTGPIEDDDKPQLEAPKEQTYSGLDPVAEARQNALSVLAGLFFDQPLEESDDESGRGFQNIVMGTGPLFSKKVNQTQIMLHLSQAVDSQLAGDSAQAAEELKRAIDVGLDNLAAFYFLGYLRIEANRLESAIRHLQRSVQHPDFSLGSRLLLGQAYYKMDRFQDAAIEYLEALKLADAMTVPAEQADGLRQLYDPLIMAQSQEEDEQRHRQLSDNIIDLLMRPKWWQHLSNIRSQLILQTEGGPPTPLAEIIMEARSSQVVVEMNTVRQLAREGRVQAAMEEAFFALQHSPNYLPLHVTIGDLLVSSGQLPEAISKFAVVARAYSVRGETGRAIDMLRRVVDMAPMDMEVRNRLIDQFMARGDNEEAIKEYIKLAEVYYSLAELANARKSYAKALRLAQITDVNPVWKIRVLHRIADIDIQSLNWRQALLIFQEICTIKPDDEKAVSQLIELNLRMGERDQAMIELDKFIGYLNENQRSDEALEFLEKQVEERSQQAMVHRRLAEQYHFMGRGGDAIKQLDKVGEILLDAGDRLGAISAIQRILDLNPTNKERYQQLLERIRSN